MCKSSLSNSPLSEQPVTSQAATHRNGVTLRVILLSLGLALFFGLVIPIIDTKMSNTPLGAQHLPIGAVGVLLLTLLLVNPVLRLVSRRLPFSRNEVLTVYSTCLFSCLVPGRGSENYFVANSIGAFYYATRENKWLDVLQPYLKPWLSPALIGENGTYGPQGQEIAQNWYLGLSAGQPIPWGGVDGADSHMERAHSDDLLHVELHCSHAASAVGRARSSGFSFIAMAARNDQRC